MKSQVVKSMKNATAGREILRDRYRYRVISVKYKWR